MKHSNVIAVIGAIVVAGISAMTSTAYPADSCGQSTATTWTTGGCTGKSTPELSVSYPWGISVTIPSGTCTDDYISTAGDCGNNGSPHNKCHYYQTTHAKATHGTGSCWFDWQCGTGTSTDVHYDTTQNTTPCAG
jgi:hypothetical protein